jgi:hypothetical protein
LIVCGCAVPGKSPAVQQLWSQWPLKTKDLAGSVSLL